MIIWGVIIYNMCPVYILIFAPLVLKETISKIQIAVIFISFLGLFLIVGHNLSEGYGYMGLVLSAISGMLYATIVLINRTFPQIIGGFLILSSTYIGEMLKDRKLSKEKDPIQI